MKQTAKVASKDPLASMELAIAYVLRYGVIICAIVITLGLGARLLGTWPVHAASSEIVARLRSGQTMMVTVPRNLPELASGLHALDPDVITCLGLLLLIALPILRVAMTVVLFLIERDYIYLAITLFVFSVLIGGMALGKMS